MKKTPILALLAIAASVSAQQAGHKISMVFTDTDAAFVLQAISKQTGVSILYNNKTKIPVTLNLSVDTADEAIRAVTSAASLVSRRAGGIYVVAPAANMKDALLPYCTSTIYTVGATAEELVVKLQSAFPYATMRAVGEKIAVTASKEDLLDIEEMIQENVRTHKIEKTLTELYMMQRMNAEDVIPLLKPLFPGIEITATTTSKNLGVVPKGDDSTPRLIQQQFGAVGLRGPEQIVTAAKSMLEKLDMPVRTEGILVKVYNLQYVNGPSVTTVLKKTYPELDVFVGPEELSIPKPVYSSSTSQIASSAPSGGLGGSGGGSGGGGSTSSGGSTGGAQSTGAAGGQSGTGAAGQSANAVGNRAKSIVLRGRAVDVDEAMKLLTEIDVKPKQVIIEVKIIETSPTDSANLGVSYTFSPVNFFDIAPGSAVSAATGAAAGTSGTTQAIGPSNFSRTPLGFNATLSAMVSKQTAKLLATPSLQVVDNDQGSFFIGNTISVLLTSAGALGATSQSIVQFPVGIILLVSPRISPDGTVTMHVNPVVSTVSSINAQGIPQTSAREAETTMIIRDGETVVLGGLIQDQDSKTISQVPGLSSLPIIGELFKYRSSTHTRNDILVSITPHIVKDTLEPKK